MRDPSAPAHDPTGGDGHAELMSAHMAQMAEEIDAFTELRTLRSVTMSERMLKS